MTITSGDPTVVRGNYRGSQSLCESLTCTAYLGRPHYPSITPLSWRHIRSLAFIVRLPTSPLARLGLASSQIHHHSKKCVAFSDARQGREREGQPSLIESLTLLYHFVHGARSMASHGTPCVHGSYITYSAPHGRQHIYPFYTGRLNWASRKSRRGIVTSVALVPIRSSIWVSEMSQSSHEAYRCMPPLSDDDSSGRQSMT